MLTDHPAGVGGMGVWAQRARLRRGYPVSSPFRRDPSEPSSPLEAGVLSSPV